MRFLNLTVVSWLLFCFRAVSEVVYIPPATAQMPKTQLIHVTVRGDYKFVYVNKINGITVMEPAVADSHYGAKARPVDFYVVPGTYSVDYQKVRMPDSGRGDLFSTTTRPIFNNSGTRLLGSIFIRGNGAIGPATITRGTATVVASPTQAGKTIVGSDFVFPRGDPYKFVYGGIGGLTKNDLNGAIANFNKAIELDPENAVAYVGRGCAKANKGDVDGAIADYTKAIEFKTEIAFAAYGARGAAKGGKGDLDGAITDLTEAIELKPDFEVSYAMRGIARKDKGDIDGAIADYTKAIQLEPNDAEAYNDRGAAKEAKGDLNGANADHAKAIQLRAKSSR
jgi:tetratricopeptide (TPR) repeat protein